MKILVIQQKMIGDVLISSIICNNLKKEFPNSSIDYMVYDYTKPVVENNPNIDIFILFDKKKINSIVKLIAFAFTVRKKKYDVVIDAYAKIESGIITLLSGANKRISYNGKGIKIAYNHKVNYPLKPSNFYGLAIERKIKLFEEFIKQTEINPYPKIFLTENEKIESNIIFNSFNCNTKNNNIVLFSIFGSEKSKTYPENYLIQLIDLIADNFDVKILFNYTENQKEQALQLLKNCKASTQKKVIFDLIGKDLRSLIKILYNCKMVIGNDGGVINMAKALNKPTFTIFSPWIKKESWSIFEDGKKHIGIHIFDFYPNLNQTTQKKELLSNYSEFYHQLKPELFSDYLSKFVKNHLSN